MPNSWETPTVWEAFAIRYAHHHRMARENFIGGDIHDGPMLMDYFVWAVRSGELVHVVDTGFDEAIAKKRGRTHLHSPADGLRKIGIEPSEVHVQDREMRFCTGRYMTHSAMRLPFDAEDVCAFVGGHSMGLQMVRVWTRRGRVVLASDAAHYYANMELGLAHPFTFHVGDTLEGYRRARELADSKDHIIRGHDPEVFKRYPAAGAGLQAWIVRLD